MTGPCFVDANVFVYVIDARDARKHARAQEWLGWLWRERLGRTSVQALSEYYAVASRKLSIPREAAWSYALKLAAWDPQPIDLAVILRAREIEDRYRLSWWDSMIVAAAQLQECRILLTEDLQDGMTFGTVRVADPFLHRVGEPAAQYEIGPVATLRHRPRGRPRRQAGVA